MTWLTGREATERLSGWGIGRDAARSALLAGLAGAPARTRGSLLYDAAAVDALKMGSEPAEVRQRCTLPIFVARLAPRKEVQEGWRSWQGVDLTAPRSEQLDAARAWWHLGERSRLLIDILAREKGRVPFVATVGGFIALGADIRGVDRQLDDAGDRLDEARGTEAGARGRRPRRGRLFTSAFLLEGPGEWCDDQVGRRLHSGPGGPFRLVWPLR